MFSVPDSLEGVNERGTNVSLRVDERVFPDVVEQKLGGFDAIINRAIVGVVPCDSS